MSATAPKFTSFRPKPKAPEQQPPEEPRHETKELRRHKPSRKRTREDRSPSRERREPGRDPSSKRVYFSDRRGDADIAKYGTLNRYDIPSYRRCGYGSVMGLLDQKIDRELSTEKGMYMTPLVRQRQKRLLTDKHAARESKRTLRLVRVANPPQPDTELDFVAFAQAGKRGRDSDNDSDLEGHESGKVDYREIDEKRDPSKADDPDTYFEHDTAFSSENAEVTRKNSELIRATRDDPRNLQAWLDLVEHQEPMMKLDRLIAELSQSDKRNLADVRISTYEEALRKIGTEEASRIVLQTGLLREARRHWDDARLTAKWQNVLREHPHSVALWFGYLDFVQSTFAPFKYEDCRVVFLQALKALQSISTADDLIAPEAKLHIFVRLTRMMQEAGYQELALATWQAVLEFSLLAPDPAVDKVQEFEAFWESEVPRIGELDSKGWKHTSIDNAVPPTLSVALEASEPSMDVFEDFSRRELQSTSKLRCPGRSTDDAGEDDPFHTIFFSDLQEFVEQAPKVSAGLMLDAFLCFCGLPGLANTSSSGTWRADPFLCNAISHPGFAAETRPGGVQYQEALLQYSQSPITRFQMTSDLLVHQTFSLQPSRLSPDFIRNVLTLLAANSSEGDLVGEYLLAFEHRHFPAEVAKSAKRLLKDRPSSLRLYNMYGAIEGRLGNSSKADQVFGAALNIKSSSADHLGLLQSYVWQALLVNNKGEALWRLVRYQGQLPNSLTMRPDSHLLELTRATLSTSLENALLGKDYASAVVNASLLALFTYLSSDCDASSALDIYGNLTAWFTSHKLSDSVHAETNAQAVARFLAYHVTHTAIVKPALLRTALESLIAAFPDNTILLSAYAANEARFSIDDRVRGNMHRVMNTSPTSSVVTWAFAIHHETLKGEIAGSTSHSVRALYERATDPDSSGGHCPALWKMFLQFEVGQLSKEHALRPSRRPRRDGKKSKWENRVEEAEDRVKETFYQGLKMLPWCKDFIMLAFTDTRDLFSEEELWRLYRVMTEKELRVYTELDEPQT